MGVGFVIISTRSNRKIPTNEKKKVNEKQAKQATKKKEIWFTYFYWLFSLASENVSSERNWCVVCVHLSVSRPILCVLCVCSVNECRKCRKENISVSVRRYSFKKKTLFRISSCFVYWITNSRIKGKKTVTFWQFFANFNALN